MFSPRLTFFQPLYARAVISFYTHPCGDNAEQNFFTRVIVPSARGRETDAEITFSATQSDSLRNERQPPLHPNPSLKSLPYPPPPYPTPRSAFLHPSSRESYRYFKSRHTGFWPNYLNFVPEVLSSPSSVVVKQTLVQGDLHNWHTLPVVDFSFPVVISDSDR